MIGCRWVKAVLVRTVAFTLCYFARIPTHDATNGLRLFSRRLLDRVNIESNKGFTYSLELIAKCHRLGWPIFELPAKWFERSTDESRFKVLCWIPPYLRWYFYIFATSWFRFSQSTIAPCEKK